VWGVETIARAGAKGLESIANDTHQAIKNRAAEIEDFGKGVAAWRASNLGGPGTADGDDLPGSLRGNGSRSNASNGSTQKTEVSS
jgi:hypothetical protein